MTDREMMVELLTGNGAVFHGGNPAGVADEWIDDGFSSHTAAKWMEAGVWCSSTARNLRKIRKSPKDLIGIPSDTVYAWCNGDKKISFAEAKKEAKKDAKKDEKRDRIAQSADDKYNAEIGRAYFYHNYDGGN